MFNFNFFADWDQIKNLSVNEPPSTMQKLKESSAFSIQLKPKQEIKSNFISLIQF